MHWGRQFEDAFENTQWRKADLMNRMGQSKKVLNQKKQKYIDFTRRVKIKLYNLVRRMIYWWRIIYWCLVYQISGTNYLNFRHFTIRHIWWRTLEENQTNASSVNINILKQAICGRRQNNATSVNIHPSGQTVWGCIWKHNTMEKSRPYEPHGPVQKIIEPKQAKVYKFYKAHERKSI